MAHNFSENDSGERLARGLGTYLNHDNLLVAGMAGSILDDDEVKILAALPQPLLLKLAQAAERHHDEAVTFVNGGGEGSAFNP